MKKIFIKSTNWVLAGIIGFFGFAGCERFGADMYGVPSADYKIKGTVVNEANGKPIPGVRAGFSPSEWDEDAYGLKPEYYWGTGTFVITNANGAFTLTARGGSGFIENIATVYLEDIDGEENGLFQPRKADVDFKDAVKGGKPSGWYGGEYTITTTIQLAEVEIE